MANELKALYIYRECFIIGASEITLCDSNLFEQDNIVEQKIVF